MTFCFNFKQSEKLDDFNSINSFPIKSDDDYEVQSNCCKYISIDNLDSTVESNNVKSIKCGEYEMKFITQESISKDCNNLMFLNEIHSDLVPGKYEGGLKVWECSIDLIKFIDEKHSIKPGYSVLELGCGVGLPGLLSYLCGAFVTFQDYNAEVLELITVPNVILNTVNKDRETVCKQCEFLCGDWGTIREHFYSHKQEKFDVILTSETIYSKSNHKKLLNLMKFALKPKGVIYLASKVHYFGVGGGIAEFENLLKEDGTFEFSTVFKNTEGVGRQILQLMFKHNE